MGKSGQSENCQKVNTNSLSNKTYFYTTIKKCENMSKEIWKYKTGMIYSSCEGVRKYLPLVESMRKVIPQNTNLISW